MSGGAIRGEAEVLEATRPEPRHREDDTAGEIDVSDYGVGRHTFLLRVTLPGQESYEVEGKFKVPQEVQFGKKRSMMLRPFVKRHRVPVGLTLPVDVDPSAPNDVTIDWDAFLAAGGQDELKRLRNAAAVEANRQAYPEAHAQMSARAIPEAEGWAVLVKAGSMSRKDFDQSVASYVAHGYLDATEAQRITDSIDA